MTNSEIFKDSTFFNTVYSNNNCSNYSYDFHKCSEENTQFKDSTGILESASTSSVRVLPQALASPPET